LDVTALRLFHNRFRRTTVVSVPRLHAKVYISDSERAIVTSANLTHGGIDGNIEYGVQLDEAPLVRRISEDMEAYAGIGSAVSSDVLDHLVGVEQDLRDKYQEVLRSARADLRQRFDNQYRQATKEFVATQVGPRSATTVFSEAILYALATVPLSTVDLHPSIQRLLPDLCDDRVELVINGERYGKKWKHQVRNAQQALKRSGLIAFDGRRWQRVRT
jgi:phosphatidylserine/phosphatidylglycerophosphate/cardiolipin synthase-like enzyme